MSAGQVNLIPYRQLPRDRGWKIGHCLTVHLQGVHGFRVGEIAPDLTREQGLGIAPAAVPDVLPWMHGGASQPVALFERWYQHLQHLGLMEGERLEGGRR